MLSIRASPAECPLDPPSPDQAQLLPSGVSTQRILQVIVVAGTALTAILTGGLILCHLLTYKIPNQQRQIIRLVAAPFVYAVVSLLQIYFYNASEYLRPIADLYEAFGLVSLLMLFAHFVESTSVPGNQVSNGQNALSMTKFQAITWVFVFQYPIVRTITLIVTEATLANGKYCVRSSHPHFASIWVTVVDALSVVLAVGSLLRFHMKERAQMAGHNPGLKLVAFKTIVFVSFLQNLIFNILNSRGTLQSGTYISYYAISRGIPAVLTCLESVIFASFDLFAFKPTEYMARGFQTKSVALDPQSSEKVAEMESVTPLQTKLPFGEAVLSALDPRDIIQGYGIAYGILSGRH